MAAGVGVGKSRRGWEFFKYIDGLEVFAGSPGADRLSTGALTLGQAPEVDTGTLGGLFVTRGIYLAWAGRRRSQGASYFREAERLAAQTSDNLALGRALANLADVLAVTDPAAAAAAARAAARESSAPDWATLRSVTGGRGD